MGAGDESHPKFVGRLFGGRRRSAIDDILSNFQPVRPVILLVIAIDTQYGFQRLICSFRLTVGLWMIGRADVLFDIQLVAELPEELGGEACVAIGDDFLRDAGIREGVISKQPRDFLTSHVFPARDQDDSLGAIMIGDGEDGIAPS